MNGSCGLLVCCVEGEREGRDPGTQNNNKCGLNVIKSVYAD